MKPFVPAGVLKVMAQFPSYIYEQYLNNKIADIESDSYHRIYLIVVFVLFGNKPRSNPEKSEIQREFDKLKANKCLEQWFVDLI